MTTPNQNNQNKVKAQIWYYLFVALIVLVIVAAVVIGYGVYFAKKYIVQNCGMEEKSADIPSQVKNNFTFVKDVEYHTDDFPYCSPIMTTTSQIVTDKGVYASNNKPIDKNTTFTIEQAFYFRQYGLSAIDSGSDWQKYFILKDSQGNISKVSCLGLDDYLKLTKSSCN